MDLVDIDELLGDLETQMVEHSVPAIKTKAISDNETVLSETSDVPCFEEAVDSNLSIEYPAITESNYSSLLSSNAMPAAECLPSVNTCNLLDIDGDEQTCVAQPFVPTNESLKKTGEKLLTESFHPEPVHFTVNLSTQDKADGIFDSTEQALGPPVQVLDHPHVGSDITQIYSSNQPQSKLQILDENLAVVCIDQSEENLDGFNCENVLSHQSVNNKVASFTQLQDRNALIIAQPKNSLLEGNGVTPQSDEDMGWDVGVSQPQRATDYTGAINGQVSNDFSEPCVPSASELESMIPSELESNAQDDLPQQMSDKTSANQEENVSSESMEASENGTFLPPESASGEWNTSNQFCEDLGATKPVWIPDAEAISCMSCESKFTFVRRRHHCRACGKVFCATCCSEKSQLQYLDFREARVCIFCCSHIAMAAKQQAQLLDEQNQQHFLQTAADPVLASTESTGPSAGVLKDTYQNRTPKVDSRSRSVMFSDGIRPGDANSHLDGMDSRPSSRSRRKARKNQRISPALQDSLCNAFLIPATGLPPLVTYEKVANRRVHTVSEVSVDETLLVAELREKGSAATCAFAIHKDLRVDVKILTLGCCVNKTCWCFTSDGLSCASQDEIILLIEYIPSEDTIPRDIFHFYKHIYEQAMKGNKVTPLRYTDMQSSHGLVDGFLGSVNHAGFLYIRATRQCLQRLPLPHAPYMFGILLHCLEIPWARLFPLRLMLRLGAEYKFYPCSLVSVRHREPVYQQTGDTIMKLLADFSQFKYNLCERVEGLTINQEEKTTTISIPRNMYTSVMKGVSRSQEHWIAFGASFNENAHAHLVCTQNSYGKYTSDILKIRDCERKVTGASFIVFNGSLKTGQGVSSKCSPVEDGLMVYITREALDDLKLKLEYMQEFSVVWGDLSDQMEGVYVRWTDDYKDYNIGVVSPIDGFPMDGVVSWRVQAHEDIDRQSGIRWTEVFFISVPSLHLNNYAGELIRRCADISVATLSALSPFYNQLQLESTLGLRITLGSEQVEFLCGANEQRFPSNVMNALDNHLIEILHDVAQWNSTAGNNTLTFELLFHTIVK